MRISKSIVTVACASAALFAVGCGGSGNQQSAEESQQPATAETGAAESGTEATGAAGAGSAEQQGSEEQQKLAKELRDARVRSAVLEQLQADAQNVSIDIDDNGAVKLSGSVNKPDDQQKAQQAAQGVQGVTQVTNDITVESPQGAQQADPGKAQDMQDQLLENKVKASLLEQLGAAALDVKVSADNGKVELSGNVKGAGKEQALSIAQGVAGPQNVTDKLDASS